MKRIASTQGGEAPLDVIELSSIYIIRGVFNHGKKSIAEYVSFIQANIDKHTVKKMCKVLKFPRSTYYAAINHVTSQREIEYNKFSEEV